MIKIENRQVSGWEAAIRGMRNPLLSYERSDSFFLDYFAPEAMGFHDILGKCYKLDDVLNPDELAPDFILGPNDKNLMKRLASAGTDHAKYRRFIVVTADVTAPLYWWKEHDQYKVGTVTNSTSTMHKIQAKEFTLDDFSHEHLLVWPENHPDGFCNDSGEPLWDAGAFDVIHTYTLSDPGYYHGTIAIDVLKLTIVALNHYRKLYLETNDKRYWWQMIQLLPSSYNQKRTVMLNYEVLANIYHARKNHKLDEWHTFCDWIESLPESWIITGEEKDA